MVLDNNLQRIDIIDIALREQLGKAIRKDADSSFFMKHPGFTNVAKQISQKEGLSFERAQAILASKTRKASPAAKKANPKLGKVRG